MRFAVLALLLAACGSDDKVRDNETDTTVTDTETTEPTDPDSDSGGAFYTSFDLAGIYDGYTDCGPSPPRTPRSSRSWPSRRRCSH